jgi:hypothetical protein
MKCFGWRVGKVGREGEGGLSDLILCRRGRKGGGRDSQPPAEEAHHTLTLPPSLVLGTFLLNDVPTEVSEGWYMHVPPQEPHAIVNR